MQLDFPYRIDRQGRTGTTDPESHVRDLIEQLLFTMPGERVMRPTLGAGLAQLVFGPNSEEIAIAVQLLVQTSLQQWLGEFVVIETVDATSTESTIDVEVQYVLRRTDERRNARFSQTI